MIWERPEGYDLHRLDNSKGYYPENCEWKEKSKHLKEHMIKRKIDKKRKIYFIISFHFE